MSSSEEDSENRKGPWDKDSDVDACTSCGVRFHMILRWKHHCRKCGHIFCSECAPSDNKLSIPEFGYLEPVRHCLRCSMGNVSDLGTVRFDRDPVPARLRVQTTDESSKEVVSEDVKLTPT